MSYFGIEMPPLGTNMELSDYLIRNFTKASNAFTDNNYNVPRDTLPKKVRVGEVYYFSTSIDANITAEGLWLYKSTGWVQLG